MTSDSAPASRILLACPICGTRVPCGANGPTRTGPRTAVATIDILELEAHLLTHGDTE